MPDDDGAGGRGEDGFLADLGRSGAQAATWSTMRLAGRMGQTQMVTKGRGSELNAGQLAPVSSCLGDPD